MPNKRIDSFVKEAYENFSSSFNEPFKAGSAVAGGHFGDEGKGKIVDILIRRYKALNYNIINYRGQGGGNAGHTVIDSETNNEYHFHYLPSGGLNSDIIFLGAGMLLDPLKVHEEASVLPSDSAILVDERATLSILMERELDGYFEAVRKSKGIGIIGTTGSGVGTTVAHRALRVHVTFKDVLNAGSPEELCRLFKNTPQVPEEILKKVDLKYCKEVYEAVNDLNVVNSSVIFQNCKREGWAGVLEISQAFGLDMIHGNGGHYVTSTHTTIPGALADAGLTEQDIPDGGVIITKAYASKVGSGPFITKFKDCGNEKKIAQYIYDNNGEKGVTTGRRRDLGWFDCVAVGEALRKNGTKYLAINCMDTLGCIPGSIAKICVAYKHKKTGVQITYWPYNHNEYVPVYKNLAAAWNIKHATSERKLPLNAWEYIATIEFYTGGKVKYIGTGASNRDIITIGEYGREKIDTLKSFINYKM